MEIINKKHQFITSNQRVDLSSYFKVADERSIYFSAGAAISFGLSDGLYMHFINDDDRWYFYCNGETDGFKLIGRQNKKSVVLCDVSLINLFLKRTRTSIGCKFLLSLTTNRIKSSQIIEILLNHPIDE